MFSKRPIKLNVLVVSMLWLSALTGCSRRAVVLHPLQPTDFYVTEKGDICMSEYYFNEVLKVKMDVKKK